jgi:hypothetical protein
MLTLNALELFLDFTLCVFKLLLIAERNKGGHRGHPVFLSNLNGSAPDV